VGKKKGTRIFDSILENCIYIDKYWNICDFVLNLNEMEHTHCKQTHIQNYFFILVLLTS
jgi:hypothetical protein